MTNPESHAEVAAATMRAIDACRAAAEAITQAMAIGGRLGTPVPGWSELLHARSSLNAVTSVNSQSVVRASAELGRRSGPPPLTSAELTALTNPKGAVAMERDLG